MSSKNYTAEDTFRDDRQYVIHSWSVQGQLNPPVVNRAEGIYMIDGNGKKIIDFASQLVNSNIGHQHPKVIAAIKEQADKLCYISPPFATEARGRAAKKIVEVTPENITKVFFVNGGAEANENAVKMARAYTKKFKILSRYRSYHGATFMAIALTGDPRRPPVEPAAPGVVKVFDPYCYRCTFGKEYGKCKLECVEHIGEVIMYENPDTVAAIIVEPVIGTNGVIVPPPEYMPRLREICDQNNVLLICDEVMTGFGRTGEMFAVNHWNVRPDIMTMAKGVNSGYVPLGAVAVDRKVDGWLQENMFWGGLTYSGHALACAAAEATIEAYQEENIVANSKAMGAIMLEEMKKIRERHRCVGDARGLGLFGCLELVKNKETKEHLVPWNGAPGIMKDVFKAAWDKGVYLMLRWNFLFLFPPLIINEQELRRSMDVIDEVLEIADKAAV
ncbi:MAG: aminotransferase class III-fold pyridoxal phosphate-dependent enzyme [Bacillota bacterium]